MNLSQLFSSTLRNVVKLRIPSPFIGMQVREGSSKHWKPEFKKLRRLKVHKVKLPDLHEDTSKMTPDQVRSRMKEMGLLPPRSWQERPMFISSTGGVFEPYVPPEGDGKLSTMSVKGAKQSVEFMSAKSKSMMAVRKIRSYDADFDTKKFAEDAQEIYIKAHTALAAKDKDSLHQCVTEICYPIMTEGLRYCTVRWQFLKSLEPPRVVHARCTEVLSKENIFSQVTVRFHTQQILAVYDRFGRLMYGSEIVAKDVLEYVVFEKHVANLYGMWRIHEKIIPDWMPPREPGFKTYIQEVAPAETTTAATDAAVPVVPVDQPLATA